MPIVMLAASSTDATLHFFIQGFPRPLSTVLCAHVHFHQCNAGSRARIPIPDIIFSMAGVHITPVQVRSSGTTTGVSGVSVTVNSCLSPASSMAPGQSATPHVAARRGVTITPLKSSQPKPIIAKSLLKAVGKKETGKKNSIGSKTFVLRCINASTVNTCSHLKALIRKQVGGEINKNDLM